MQTDTMTLRELRVRYSTKKSSGGQPIIIGRAVTRPIEAVPALMTILQDEPNEVFAILCLTKKYRVIAVHLHPSGDPTPSPNDLEVTRRLAASGEFLGIDLVDHISIGDHRYCSLKETGRIQRPSRTKTCVPSVPANMWPFTART